MVTEQQRNWSLVLPPDDRGGDGALGAIVLLNVCRWEADQRL